jgi:hypothetical protein
MRQRENLLNILKHPVANWMERVHFSISDFRPNRRGSQTQIARKKGSPEIKRSKRQDLQRRSKLRLPGLLKVKKKRELGEIC